MSNDDASVNSLAPRRGAAYMCNDGLIRWVTHVSNRGFYHVAWRNVGDDVWHYGGRYLRDAFAKILVFEEVAPQQGSSVRFVGVMGTIEVKAVGVHV